MAEPDNTLSPVTENKPAEVASCTDLNSVKCEVSSSHNEHLVSQQTSALSAVSVRTSDRKKRSVNQHLGITSQKKQRR